MWDIDNSKIDYKNFEDKSKLSFHDLVKKSLNDLKIDKQEAISILEIFDSEREQIIQNSKDALKDLKDNLGIKNWDIDWLVNKLNIIKGESKKDKSSFIDQMSKRYSKEQFSSFSEINEKIKQENWWKSLYDIMNTDNILINAWITPEDFEKNYNNYISMIMTWVDAWEFAIYSAFAEEANFDNNNWGYEIKRYWWMNIPHKIVLNKFNSMLSNINLNSEWNVVWWVWKILLDDWKDQWKFELNIDFNNNTITPEIFLLNSFWKRDSINIEHIKNFIHLYTKVQNWFEKPLFIKNWNNFKLSDSVNPDALNILNTSWDVSLLVHEWQHALYSAEPKYRELIHERVRWASEQQKKAALLAASINYDIFDKDMVEINKWIVIDEMFNAYYNEWIYNYKNMTWDSMVFGLDKLINEYWLDFSWILDDYSNINDLPIKDSEKQYLKETFPTSKLTEKEFIKENESKIISDLGDMNLALNFLKKKSTNFYEKIENSKKLLLDWI